MGYEAVNELSRDLLALDRKQRRLVTGLLAGHCMLRRILHLVGFWESSMCRKCGQEEECWEDI
jgi:hypothetical protein